MIDLVCYICLKLPGQIIMVFAELLAPFTNHTVHVKASMHTKQVLKLNLHASLQHCCNCLLTQIYVLHS